MWLPVHDEDQLALGTVGDGQRFDMGERRPDLVVTVRLQALVGDVSRAALSI
jgi:hypothetical protein